MPDNDLYSMHGATKCRKKGKGKRKKQQQKKGNRKKGNRKRGKRKIKQVGKRNRKNGNFYLYYNE